MKKKTYISIETNECKWQTWTSHGLAMLGLSGRTKMGALGCSLIHPF